MPDLIKVAIVDDNRTTVNSLQELLDYSDKTRVVIRALSGSELLEKLKASPPDEFPDVVITDVNMPGMSGIDVVRHGRALYPQLKFLMLSVYDDDDTLFDAIQAGANGYLMKDERISVIVNHITALFHEGGAPMSPRIARKTLNLLAHSSKQISHKSNTPDIFNLTAREKEVLQFLVDGNDYRSIANELEISPFTVRKHIANIYDKLHVSSRAQVIKLMQSKNSVQFDANEKTCRILLVDDHQMILDSLAMMLSSVSELLVVGKISNPKEVGKFLSTNHVDLVISDINMPEITGLELSKQIKSTYPKMPVLLLTVSDDQELVQQAYEFDLDGYILKKANKAELTTAIRVIMEGQRYFPEYLLN